MSKSLGDYPWMKFYFARFMAECMGKTTAEIGDMVLNMALNWSTNNYESLPNFAKYAADERISKSDIYKESKLKTLPVVVKKEQLSTTVNNSEQLPISLSISSKSFKSVNTLTKTIDNPESSKAIEGAQNDLFNGNEVPEREVSSGGGEDSDLEAGSKKNKARPSSVQEVREYCEKRDNGIDPEKFFEWYSARGWMLGKTPIKDWKACIRTWEISDREKKSKCNSEDDSPPPPAFNAKMLDDIYARDRDAQ